MIVERLNLQTLGLSTLHLPLCTDDEAVALEEFVPRAKDGFALAVRADVVTQSELFEFLFQTTPLSIFTGEQIVMKEGQNTLPEFQHALATIAYLLELRQVSFDRFTTTPPNLGYNLAATETYWNRNYYSIGHLWQIFAELETLIRASLYKDQPIPTSDLLKVGHFFAAGQEISKIFVQ